MRIDRRRALALLGLGGAAAPVSASAAPHAGMVAFNHGVASGDPLADRVMIWTRITPSDPAAGDIAYTWRLEPGGPSGKGVTGPGRDFTAKVDVKGLKPGTEYTYVFEANGVVSPRGRTRTLPVGSTKDVVFAVTSCALYPAGYFNVYQAIADQPRLDAVIHLGDYIYEYGGPGSYGMDSSVAGERPHAPNREIVSLADYRVRHAQYRGDPDLQAASARAAWIVVWDDHETANDSYKDGAENHDPQKEGDWAARKAAAIRAYYEWMPIREPVGGGAAIQRSFQFGDVATLFMLETRLTARVQQLSYETDLNGPDGQPDRAGFMKKLHDPARRMMGPDQAAWLGEGMAASRKAGTAWQVLGAEVVMAKVVVPSAKKEMSEAAFAEAMAGASEAGKRRIARLDRAAALDLPYGLDMWDGYPADRERLYAMVRKAGARAIALAGDSHSFWANELHDEAGVRAGIEFGTSSVTSPGGGDALATFPIGEIFAKANKEVVFNDQSSKGFVLLTLTKDKARADMVAVSTIVARAFTTRVVKAFTAVPEAGGVSALSEA